VATDLHSRESVLFVTAPTPDPRAALVLNTWLDTDRLIGFVQPTLWSDYGMDTARCALDAAYSALLGAQGLADLTVANRLQRAVMAANDAVIDANHSRYGNDIERRVGVGMALCLRSGRTATMALVPPMQALLFQGSAPTWFPRRESWTGDDRGLSGTPLGWSADPAPTLVSTIVEHADEIVLTSTHVAASLAHSDELPTSAGALCDRIATMADGADPVELVALSTRFEPGSLTGSIRATTQHVLSLVDHRARAVWTALRAPA
jgi:hypothetical protein